MDELHRIIGSDETVLWQGKPRFWPFVLPALIVTIISSGVFFGFFYTLYDSVASMEYGVRADSLSTNTINPIQTMTSSFSMLSNSILIIGLFSILLVFLYYILKYQTTHYAVTNKRVLFQTGIIGRDYRFIDFDKITNAEINVGFFDMIFGNAGSIKLFSAGTPDNRAFRSIFGSVQPTTSDSTPYTLCNIKNPYEVFKFFKKTSFDVKTDINYPNKYRPKTNPEQQTENNTVFKH